MRSSGQHRMKRVWHNSSALEHTLQNYFLAYHELKAHVQWLVSRPADAGAYKRFQVGKCACFVYVSLTCHSHISSIGVGFIWMLVLTLGARSLLYHCDLHEYVGLAVHVMWVCRGQLGMWVY